MRSKHDTERFLQALKWMSGYVNQSTPLRPQLRLGARDTVVVGEEQTRIQRTQAEWLRTIHLSSSSNWEFPLKTLPRPKGKATRVIVTEYDLPRPTNVRRVFVDNSTTPVTSWVGRNHGASIIKLELLD